MTHLQMSQDHLQASQNSYANESLFANESRLIFLNMGGGDHSSGSDTLGGIFVLVVLGRKEPCCFCDQWWQQRSAQPSCDCLFLIAIVFVVLM
jgi:hypothetical protein